MQARLLPPVPVGLLLLQGASAIAGAGAAHFGGAMDLWPGGAARLVLTYYLSLAVPLLLGVGFVVLSRARGFPGVYSRKQVLLAVTLTGLGPPCFLFAFGRARSGDEILFLTLVVLPSVSGALIGWCPRGFLELLGLATVYATSHAVASLVHDTFSGVGSVSGLTAGSTACIGVCAFLTLAARMGLGYPREYAAG